MCLTINYLYHDKYIPQARKAETDIRCYKIFYVANSKLYTPFQLSQVKLTKIKKCFKADIFCRSVDNTTLIIQHGIHAYTTEETAIKVAKQLSAQPMYINFIFPEKWNTTNKMIVIPVIIPKGTFYWMGICGDICAEYIQFPGNWKDYLK